jgi:hypothetical protein
MRANMNAVITARCCLCHETRILRKSHIVPEFLHSKLYNEKGHMMGICGRGPKGWKPLQQGLTERLFCDGCEQHFNDCFEKPFYKLWCVGMRLPCVWDVEEPYWMQVDYCTFKLFHLSVLFRAGVSSLPTYREVALGPHEEQIRRMLLARDAGPFWKYPIVGRAIVNPTTHRIVDMITGPEMLRNNLGQAVYRMAYGGCEWYVMVSYRRSSVFEKVALTGDGRMPVTSVLWGEVESVRRAASALAGSSQAGVVAPERARGAV